MSVLQQRPVPNRIGRLGLVVRATLPCVALLVAAACLAPSPKPGPTQRTDPPPVTGSPSPSLTSPDPDTPFDELAWYQVDRIHDTQGNETRILYVGSLDGSLLAEVTLTSTGPGQNLASELLDLVYPHAAGFHGGGVLVWGHEQATASLELFRPGAGFEPRLANLDGVVQVATADADLRSVYYVTIDPDTLEPNGLWAREVGGTNQPTRLPFDFPERERSQHRLTATADGSIVAIQPMPAGAVTLIDVRTAHSRNVESGGAMIGFVQDRLVALGPSSDTEAGRPVFAYARDGQGVVVADHVDAAQIVPGRKPWIAVMRITPEDPRHYEISLVDLMTGASSLVYRQEGPEIAPMLAAFERTAMGAQLPPDTALLADSFAAFIDQRHGGDPPPESFPQLLDLGSRQVRRLGTDQAP